MNTIGTIADALLSSLKATNTEPEEAPPPWAPDRWTSDHLEFDTSGESLRVCIRSPYDRGCSLCHTRDGWIVDGETRTARRCEQCLPVRRRVARWNRASLPSKFYGKPFDRSRVNHIVLGVAELWLESFINGGADSLVLCGLPGVGKSFLAYELARRVLSRRLPVRWVRWTQVLADIRNTYGSDSSLNEREVWADVLGSEGVVIVDDFGDGSGTDWAKAQATHMLECLPSGLRLIITTNATMDGRSGIHLEDALGIRAASRIYGATGGGRFMVNVIGKDQRKC